MPTTIRDFPNEELIKELQRRNGASCVFVRQKTNVKKDKYLLGISGNSFEVTKLMVIGSDFVMNRFDEEENDNDDADDEEDEDDDFTDRWGHFDPPDGSLL